MDAASHFGDLSIGEPDPLLASLEQRVHRLEEAVAILQEKKSVDTPQVKAGPPPIEDVAAPLPAHNEPPISAAPARSSWLLVDIIAEARAMVRMFFDIHYRMAWYTRITVLIILIMILVSNWWLGWVPVLGFVLIKLWDLVLAFLAYKILSREAQRYREWRGRT
jgi:hypothetical protein